MQPFGCMSRVVDRLSLFGRHWVKVLEFDSGIGCGESPISSELFLVAFSLPSVDLLVHLRDVVESSVNALTTEDAQFHLTHVEPAAVARGMDQTESFG